MNLKFITLSRPYAKAIFNIAIKENTTENWIQQLKLCSEIVKNKYIQQQYHRCINPKNLSKIFINIGNNYLNQQTKNLIKILSEKKRLLLLPNILNYFQNLIQKNKKIINVKLISARPLESTILNVIHEKLFQYFSKKIYIKYKIDSSIIEGIIIKTNNITIDCSIKTQLKKLSNKL